MMGSKRLLAFVCFLALVRTKVETQKLYFRDEHRLREEERSEKVGAFPFQDPSLPWDQRVDDLVSRLTLEDIVPQTEAMYGGQTPAIPALNILPYVWISECLHGDADTHGTAFPQSIGLAATFRL
jgi:beta-glucosidase-like glycosyl hydrolase